MSSSEEIDELRSDLEDIVLLIALLLARSVVVSPQDRAKLHARIQANLRNVEDTVTQWASRIFEATAIEQSEFLIQTLDLSTDAEVLASQFVEKTTREFGNVVRQASLLTDRLAQELQSPVLRERSIRRLLGGVIPDTEEKIAKSVQETLQSGFVNIVGRDGKIRKYAYDYLIALEAVAAEQRMKVAMTRFVAESLGIDLVQVSSNPSTVGDFCDLYRGRVFSLSGTHPVYPPLAETPRGGPPFHPWCRHDIFPVTDEDSITSSTDLPESMRILALDPSASANDFQKEFLKLRSNG